MPAPPAASIVYFFDWENKSFWPETYQDEHVPYCLLDFSGTDSAENALVFGCTDGYLRKHATDYTNYPKDDALDTVNTELYIGPISLSNDYNEGMLVELIGVLAEDSGEVKYSIGVGDTYEDAVANCATPTDIWSAGNNYTVRPRARGRAMVIRLASDGVQVDLTTKMWALEHIIAVVKKLGKERKA